MNRKCTSCGSDKFEPGKLQSTGRISFRPKNTKFLSLKTADIEVEGNICTDCGHIMLVGDAKKAKALVSGTEDPV